MNYIRMTASEAIKVLGENGTVLVAVQDLEHRNDILSFSKKTKNECKELIESAQTIIKHCDDFVREMDLYAYGQPSIKHIVPIGKEIIILY